MQRFLNYLTKAILILVGTISAILVSTLVFVLGSVFYHLGLILLGISPQI